MKRKHSKTTIRPLPADYVDLMRRMPFDKLQGFTGDEIFEAVSRWLLSNGTGFSQVSDTELTAFVNENKPAIANALQKIALEYSVAVEHFVSVAASAVEHSANFHSSDSK